MFSSDSKATSRSNEELERRVQERTRELKDVNRALQQSEQKLAAELEVARHLQEVSTQLFQSANIGALYEHIMDAAVAILHSDFASIQLLATGREAELHLIGYRGFTAQAAQFWEWVRPASASSCGEVLRTKKRCIIPDVDDSDLLAGSEDLETFRQTDIRAVQSTPLLSRSGGLLGVFSTHWRNPHVLSVGETRSLDVLARLASDLIERSQAEAALRESEQEFRAVADLVPGFLWRYDAEGQATWCNRRWVEYTGQTVEDARGRGWLDVIHPEDRAASLSAFQGGVTVNEPFRLEHRIRQVQGTYRWFLLQVRPVPGQAGHVVQWFGIATDIDDEQNALAARLLAAQEEERRRVAAELHDDFGQRIVALEMEASRLSSFLRRKGSPPRELLDSMRTNIRSLVDDIRNTSHRLHPSILQDFGLAAALQNLVTEFQRLGGHATLNLCEPSHQLPAQASLALFRIAQEALQNVAKHATGAQVDVTLSETDGHLVLSVKDTGPGFNVEDSRCQVGLGLLSMRERARQLRADLLIQTLPGNGTYITVRVPAGGRHI